MHRIAVISDTHNLLRPEVLEIIKTCEVIVHAGDISTFDILEQLKELRPLFIVRGNNDRGDWASDLPHVLTFELFGRKVCMTHIKRNIPQDPDADLVIYGHSHRYSCAKNGDAIFLNPGSCGPRRFNQEITMAVLTLYEEGETAGEESGEDTGRCATGSSAKDTGNCATGSSTTGISTTGSSATGRCATGSSAKDTGNCATGISATGNSATGNSATGESATGSCATGESATGKCATGSSATGNCATGSSATGNCATGNSAKDTGSSATGSSATGNSATGSSATGSCATGESATGSCATGISTTGSSAKDTGSSTKDTGRCATGSSTTGISAKDRADRDMYIERIDIPHETPVGKGGSRGAQDMKNVLRTTLGVSSRPYQSSRTYKRAVTTDLIRRVCNDIDRERTVEEIAARRGIDKELAEQITRMYLTHQRVTPDEIMTKLGL